MSTSAAASPACVQRAPGRLRRRTRPSAKAASSGRAGMRGAMRCGSRTPAASSMWRLLTPDAWTMNALLEFRQRLLAAAPCAAAFSASTQALKLATSSSLVTLASGISTPMPLMLRASCLLLPQRAAFPQCRSRFLATVPPRLNGVYASFCGCESDELANSAEMVVPRLFRRKDASPASGGDR